MISSEKMENPYQHLQEEHVNIQNFYSKPDQERLDFFINDTILKYISKKTDLLLSIDLSKSRNDEIIGINGNIIELPNKKESLWDEMNYIYSLTRLISIISRDEFHKSLYDEVIPSFNVYEYLKNIHSFYTNMYLKYKKNLAVEGARKYEKWSGLLDYEAIHEDLISYLILNKMKDNYNIKYLNKINSSDKPLARTLEKKGYHI